ncbi:hypothetical protein AB0I53_39640 [Saccharopolyspora sp. NPDC050389]|uniref:hypothetical protein n=1 Tax=Saccharopolyspora sp. NPDC050389 TaxID=3155516 RepID=UPI0033C5515C
MADVLPALILLGVGFALAMPSLATLAMSAATPEDSGVASGMFNTMQQVGSAFGLAILSTLATAHTNALLTTGEPPAEAITSGYRLAFIVGAAFVATALLLAATVVRTRQAPPTTREQGNLPVTTDSQA